MLDHRGEARLNRGGSGRPDFSLTSLVDHLLRLS